MSLAWYAAYGSNTDRERFNRYLARCSAPSEPLDDRSLLIDLPLYFGRDATSWGRGGVAFAGPGRDVAPSTLARAWLLPAERIAEIGAMENGREPAGATLDVSLVATERVVRAFPGGWYDSWFACGELDGRPVVTITSSVAQAPNPPGPRYAAVVARGLRVTHGLDDDAVAAYLAPRAGLSVDVLLAWAREGQRSSRAND